MCLFLCPNRTLTFSIYNLLFVLKYDIIEVENGDTMKKTIRDYDLTNKKVIIRCDFNVPIKDGQIQDDNRIKERLNYKLKN